jgi:hypothetical protein
VDNSDQSPLEVRHDTLARIRALMWHMYDLCDYGTPATFGLCMECEKDGTALWLYGDFLLCHRCTARRLLVKREFEQGAR